MNAVRVLRSGVMPNDGVSHGFLTREGGVSEGPFRSLNCGFGSNDVRAHVAENRWRALATVGLQDAPLITPIQVHGARVLVVAEPAGQPEKADAIVTRIPQVAIGILTADCAPVLLVDPQARVLGAAHAGWKGAVAGVLQQTVAAMETIGAKRKRIVAAIGPSIAQASYEVDPPFAEPFLQQDPGHKSPVPPLRQETPVRSARLRHPPARARRSDGGRRARLRYRWRTRPVFQLSAKFAFRRKSLRDGCCR